MESRVYSKAYTVWAETSINSTALLDLLLPNNTNKLVLFNAAYNTSKIAQATVPGGNLTSFSGIASAGGKFFLSWTNTSTGRAFFQEVTLSGNVSLVTLPIGNSLSWSFPYGNVTALYAFSSRFLVQINPVTLELVANYSSSLPAHVGIDSVLPVGARLNLAGYRTLTNGATNAYYGFLNLTSGKVTNVSKTIKTYPVGLDALFTTLIQHGSYIFVGGVLETYNGTTGARVTVGGYFYQFTPTTSKFTNLSSILPAKPWGVWGLEPWATTIGLSLGGYNTSAPGEATRGGIFALESTELSLVNESSLFPRRYVPDFWEVTSYSDGWFFSGGFKKLGGPAEVVAGKGLPLTVTSPNSEAGGQFGYSVAVSGTTVVVGAPYESASGLDYAGHAYVFNTKTGVVKGLTSPNARAYGFFGYSVAISGTTVVVGAYLENASGVPSAGHAYVFSATTGDLISTLTSPNAQDGGGFGSSVAISGTTVVVGAGGETFSGNSSNGRAYSFNATSGDLISTLIDPTAHADGYFGYSVAISGTTVVVGAPYENVSGGVLVGRAYTFNVTTGDLISTLTNPDTQSYGYLGFSVAIEGTTVAVGATGDTTSVTGAGLAYTFNATTGGLILTLASPSEQYDGSFGYSVGLSGTTLVVGAPYEYHGIVDDAGQVYTFDAATGNLTSTLTSPNAQSPGYFGWSVEISGTTIGVGAPLETVAGGGYAGHAYLF